MLMRFFLGGTEKAWRGTPNRFWTESSARSILFRWGLLLKTWFAPFRQIDAGSRAGGSLDERIRRALDKLFVAIYWRFLRTFCDDYWCFFYIAGKTIFGLLGIILWIFAPILPIVFVVIFTTGWTPQVMPMLRAEFSKMNFSQSSNAEKSQSESSIFNFGGSR